MLVDRVERLIDDTQANRTWTPEEVLGGFIHLSNVPGFSYTRTFPDAVDVVAAIPNAKDGDAFWLVFETHTSDVLYAAGVGNTFIPNIGSLTYGASLLRGIIDDVTPSSESVTYVIAAHYV